MTSTVYIAKNVYGGDGLGRLGDGRVVFVPGAWAGENVKAEIVEEKRHFVKARLVEVVEASPDRVDGAALANVPGLVYAGLSVAGETAAKNAQLVEFLERARLVPEGWQGLVGPSSDEVVPLNYRNKAVYHFARERGKWAIGYRTEPTHAIVDVEQDPLVVKPINDKLPEIRRSVLALLTTGPVAVRRGIEQKGNVTIRWTPKSGVKWWVGDAPKDLALKETTHGLDFEVPADGFYQVNPGVGERLADHVTRLYEMGRAEAPELVDLYCGVGVFGLCCRPPKLIGVESGRQAVEFARRNAARLKLEAKFFAEQVGPNMRRIPIGPRTTVIVDPPRSGMEPNVPKALAASQAPRIIYVSCDPATLVRDLKTICRGGYAVESVRRFAMFPRTARFETVVGLTRGRPA